MKTAAEFYSAFERAGFLSAVTWYPRAAGALPVSGMVRYRKPTQEVYGDAIIITDHSIKFPATQFAGVVQGDIVDIGTAPTVQRFRIKELPADTDGVQRTAYLQPVLTGTPVPPAPAPSQTTGSDSGLNSQPIAFAFGDASPRSVLALLTTQTVLQVNANIVSPFNGVGATLSLGTFAQPSLLVAPAHVDLGIPAEFEVNPNARLIGPIDIVLTITPGAGATQGDGWIVIERVKS